MLPRHWIHLTAILLAVLMVVASPAMATLFAWSGAAPNDDDWSNELNWNSLGCTVDCYPKSQDDDAGISVNGAIVRLSENLSIDDLNVTGIGAETIMINNVNPPPQSWTVTANTLTVSGVIMNVDGLAGLHVVTQQ